MLIRTVVLTLAGLLGGCQQGLSTPAGRVGFLVLLPAAIIFGLLWAMSRGRKRKGPPRGGPDYDERDE
jgi:hypothetical protein